MLKWLAISGFFLMLMASCESVSAQEEVEQAPERGARKERERIVDMSVLFKYEADEEGFLAKALFGLFKLEKEGTKYSRLAVRPFLYRESDDEHRIYDTTFFYGLAGWHREGETLSSWALPLYYFKSSPDRKTVLAPFVYTDVGVDFSTYLFYPFFGHSQSPEREKYYLGFPFFSYAHYKSGKKVLNAPFPFLRYSSGPAGDWFHLFPLVWYDANPEGDGVLILFPAFWAVSAPDTHFTLIFPLYWDYVSEDSSFFLLLPFYGRSKGVDARLTLILFPLYWDYASKDSSFFMVMPFYCHLEAEDYRSTMLGFPLFSYTRRKLPDHRELGYCDTQIDLVWPVSMVRTSPRLFHLRLFPIYYGRDYSLTEDGKRGECVSNYFHILPLFWSYDYPDRKLFHLWPYGYLKSKDGKESHHYLAFPLIHIHTYEPQGLFKVNIPAGLALFKYESINVSVDTLEGRLTGKQRETRLFPLFKLLTRPGKFELAVLPLMTYRELIDDRREKHSYANVLLYSFFGEWHKEYSEWRLFYALSHYERSEEGSEFYLLDMSFLFDWQLFSYVDKKEKGEVELSPIFKYRSRKDDYEFNAILGIFGWGRKKGDTYLKLFWFLKPKL